MARAAAMCLVLSCVCFGVGVRLDESHGESGGLAAMKKNLMHGVTGATQTAQPFLRRLTKVHHKKSGKGTGEGFLNSPNRVLPSQP